MSIFVGLSYFFSSLSVLSSIFVVLTKNPIFSILFLILAFVNVSCSLFLFSFEFLPLSFLVIYVGAIAILFLFVLMMLNIKLSVLSETHPNFIPFSLFFFLAFTLEFFFFFGHEFVSLNFTSSESVFFFFDFVNRSSFFFNFEELLTLFSNLKLISISLFSSFLFEFIIGGFILLLAMIASITLTLQKLFLTKSQNFYGQILADFTNTLTFYKD